MALRYWAQVRPGHVAQPCHRSPCVDQVSDCLDLTAATDASGRRFARPATGSIEFLDHRHTVFSPQWLCRLAKNFRAIAGYDFALQTQVVADLCYRCDRPIESNVINS